MCRQQRGLLFSKHLCLRRITWRALERHMSAQEWENLSGEEWTGQNRSVSSPQESEACAFMWFRTPRLRALLSIRCSSSRHQWAPPSRFLLPSISEVSVSSLELRKETKLLWQHIHFLSAGPRSPKDSIWTPGSFNIQGLSTSDASTSIILSSLLLKQKHFSLQGNLSRNLLLAIVHLEKNCHWEECSGCDGAEKGQALTFFPFPVCILTCIRDSRGESVCEVVVWILCLWWGRDLGSPVLDVELACGTPHPSDCLLLTFWLTAASLEFGVDM